MWSCRQDSSHQRWYDAAAVSRLEQILLLRRLQLPVKEIQAILKTQDLQVAPKLWPAFQTRTTKPGATSMETQPNSESRKVMPLNTA